MDFEALGNLLGDWTVTDCDPIWMIRKTALLWESNRNDEAEELVKSALSAIRAIPDEEGSVAGASREGWALWSALTLDNRQELDRRWDELAALKCDAMLERDLISRRIEGRAESQEAPHFDLGVRSGKSLRFSNERRDLAAYRAVRLSEVAGLPPVTNYPVTEYKLTIGSSVASGILRSAAVEMATIEPELAIRLILRVSDSETDDALKRVLTRTRTATLSDTLAEGLSDICIGVIQYAVPRLHEGDKRPPFWISRMNVAVEVLSRTALRASPESVESFLDIALLCYQRHEVVREFELHRSIGNLLRRTWEALPKNRRTARAEDLLSLPILGMDNFTAHIPDRFPDPGKFLKSEDLPTARTPESDGQWHDMINLLVRGLNGDTESRQRAASRIQRMSDRGLLTEAESSVVAQAIWSDKYTASNSLPGGTGLFDWTFLFLPEPSPDMGDRLFRLKWLSGDSSRFQDSTQNTDNVVRGSFGASRVDPDKIENVLWNVGSAISMSRNHGRAFQLSDSERKYLVKLIEIWANTDLPPYSDPFSVAVTRESIRWTLQEMASILTEVVIPEPVAGRLYDKLRGLTDSGISGFELIHGLIKAIPDRFDDFVTWLRMGLASDHNALAKSAVAGLHFWLVAPADTQEVLQSPPEDLLREVGFIIASRRSAALPQALQLATWVFSEGLSDQRSTISDSVTQGLGYLAEELKYERARASEDNIDRPLLRLLCVELAQVMAQKGFREEATIELWLQIGKEDPLPEVRYAAAQPGDNGDVES